MIARLAVRFPIDPDATVGDHVHVAVGLSLLTKDVAGFKADLTAEPPRQFQIDERARSSVNQTLLPDLLLLTRLTSRMSIGTLTVSFLRVYGGPGVASAVVPAWLRAALQARAGNPRS